MSEPEWGGLLLWCCWMINDCDEDEDENEWCWLIFGGTDGGKGWSVFDDDQYCFLVRHEVSFFVCHIARMVVVRCYSWS